MPKAEFENFARKHYAIIFVVDTSGSTAGTHIAMINQAIPSCIEKLKERRDLVADFDLQYAVLELNSICTWLTGNELMPIDEFTWKELFASGHGAVSLAANELNDKLSRRAFFSKSCGYYRPLIVFLTDGATSSLDEEVFDAVAALNKNRWYQLSTKIVISISEVLDAKTLYELVGDKDAILTVPLQAPLDEILYGCIMYAGYADFNMSGEYRTLSGAVGARIKDEYLLQPDECFNRIVEKEESAINDNDDWGEDWPE